MRLLCACVVLGLSAHGYAQGIEQQLLSFGSPNQAGQYPMSSLIMGLDGAFYGTTSDGGAGTNGTVCKINTNDTDFTVLHAFSNTGGDGRNPHAGLVQGTDGALYGTVLLSLSGLPGFTYRIDASTNLLNWVPVTNFLNPSEEVQFIDSGASNFPQRFYRAVWTY